MADIVHEFIVSASPSAVFTLVATPEGLAQWWTKSSTGRVEKGAAYDLDFGPSARWAGVVTRCEPDTHFELEITRAQADWMSTRVGFALAPEGEHATRVTFHHTGWPAANEHWRASSYCWAMYLRLMRRHAEHGEFVPYGKRLEA